ncbi:SGNH/GDSL hydrolase family protein [Phyllobacterium sp. YR531]|uniref:SGNH/GDSL hydrolase family protein n=1 Tax=Phyllobacterium sp. YR531 TaxID=1144343 RepID=UPI00026FB2A1|nr:SGNH/GDSL hydrolase family protein [Phyllobacterium sp. YR531]EJN00444.1 lysophospholipase L1-like esterase [Phyllobacterium sp. YR531]
MSFKSTTLRLFAAYLIMAFSFINAASAQENWQGSWGASPAFAVGPELNNATIRQYVRISVGGSKVRFRFSNETGTQPLVIGAARVARPGNAPGSIDPASSKVLTFGGQNSITIPAGAPAISDPVDLSVAPFETLAVSLFLSRWTGPSVVHPLGEQTAYLSEAGDSTEASSLPDAKTSTMRFLLSRVEVAGEGSTLVTLGDSITDGYSSGVDVNKRWPDVLAERLKADGAKVGVVNAGISGNRILHDQPEAMFGPSALSRLDRDVLSVPNLRWVVIMEGINDIGHSTSAGLSEQNVTSDEIIGGLRQLISRIKGHGAKAYCATLTPYEGTVFANYYKSEGEEKRQAVNEWIRNGKNCDAVIDFDAAVRDAANPKKLRAEFDEGDHLHPNATGYKAMADSIDLGLFR